MLATWRFIEASQSSFLLSNMKKKLQNGANSEVHCSTLIVDELGKNNCKKRQPFFWTTAVALGWFKELNPYYRLIHDLTISWVIAEDIGFH